MIPKMSSQALNEILGDAQERIGEVGTKVNMIKSDVQQKLSIMRHETEYTNAQYQKLAAGQFKPVTGFSVLTRGGTGRLTSYGTCVHGLFIKEPTNVFNLKVAGTGEIFFRNDVKVAVNNVALDRYADVLKHDSLNKQIFFGEYDKPELTLTIQTEEKTKLLGPTRFNMIEIDSFLNGSYNIKKLNIYTLGTNGEYKDTPETYTVPAVGKARIVLPKKVSFYKVELVIELLYKASQGGKDVYPFGLKHLYFYDADMQPESYAVVPIERDSTIAIIKDAIKVRDVFGVHESTLTKEGIEIFVDYNGTTLETIVYPSTSTQRNEIARGVKTIYAKVPLAGKSLVGIAFDVETRS